MPMAYEDEYAIHIGPIDFAILLNFECVMELFPPTFFPKKIPWISWSH